MKLAYFSPLSPQHSGIADYSEELLPYLAAEAEISLFVNGVHPTNHEIASRFEVLDYQNQPRTLNQLDRFDAIVYHIGNDHRYHASMLEAMKVRPGIVVFHDFALQDFYLGMAREKKDLRVYLDQVELCHGVRLRNEAARDLARGSSPAIFARPLEFPLNCRIAKSAEGIIVHSEWSARRFATIAPGVPVAQIKHHITARAAATPAAIKRNGANGRVTIASFGLITPDKGIERALRALAQLRHDFDFHYTLVGSAANFPALPELLRRHDLEGRVSVTGYVSLDEFQERILETDIAINLRERSVGATSGSLCRIMAAGIPAVISNVGAFSEFPDDAVVKIEHDRHGDALLQAYLRRLIEDAPLRQRIGKNARQYVLAQHNIETSAARYAAFIREVISFRPRKQLLDSIKSEMSLLGVRPEDEAILQSVATEIAMVAPVADFASKDEIVFLSPPIPVNGDNGQHSTTESNASSPGRFPKVEGIDYRRGALDYAAILDDELTYYLKTKPFCNVGGKNRKPFKHTGDGMDPETQRHFNDFANMAAALALRAGAKILDVGCGPGWLSEYFARLGYDVTGIDINDDLIDIARERLQSMPYKVDHQTPLRCRFLTHDIEAEPIAKKFDAVICYDALHHFEDEQKVFRHLAAMLDTGGLLFILEGQKPSNSSATGDVLREIMRDYQTLESPFSETYLRTLLNQHGFAVVGDFVSVNGLFEREMLEPNGVDQSLPLRTIDTNYHYLTCMKVAHDAPATSVPDSRSPGVLRAQLELTETLPPSVEPGVKIELPLSLRNDGDTLWLAGQTVRAGLVMPGIRIFDQHGNIIRESHGPLLPRAVAPGQSLAVNLEFTAPPVPGKYNVKIDLVDQHVCWFEEKGSEPLVIWLEVGTN
jgi:glycosyltransferase involved in cell wall biosynthesis/SAM-dependent methyltransferase